MGLVSDFERERMGFCALSKLARIQDAVLYMQSVSHEPTVHTGFQPLCLIFKDNLSVGILQFFWSTLPFFGFFWQAPLP